MATENGSANPTPKQQHYKDWPNAAGFETDFEQREPVELKVTGTIPSYAAGNLYRTGPYNYRLTSDKGKKVELSHWFDGFKQTHRFDIVADGNSSTKVYYNSRVACDVLLEEMRKTGSYKDYSFGNKRDPCQSFFQKLQSVFTAPIPATKRSPTAVNVGVSLYANFPGLEGTKPLGESSKLENASGIDSLITRTDANVYQYIDPETLEPAGVCDQTILHPSLKGPLSATHSKADPVTGNVYNYNLDFGRKPTYRVFEADASTGKTSILATIQGPAAYLHSLLITPNTVVLCVWNSYMLYNGAAMLYNRNVIESIAPMDTTKPAIWYIIDRSPARRGLLATYHTPAFFCFHSINAYEEPSPSDPSKVDIIADLVAYSDLSVIHRFYYDNLTSTSPNASSFLSDPTHNYRAGMARYRLPSIPLTSLTSPTSKTLTGTREWLASPKDSLELPTLNPHLHTKKHRYVYGVTDTGESSFFDGLGKFDSETQKTESWMKRGHSPGEPIFVPNPSADPEVQEDDGILLSVVLDGFKGTSYLLVLDAKTLEELATAEVGGVVGIGFHGQHVPKGGRKFVGNAAGKL